MVSHFGSNVVLEF